MLKQDSSENTTFCHSVCQWWHSHAHCSLRHWWCLDSGSRHNGMRVTSPALKRQRRTVEADRSKSIVVFQRWLNTVDEAVQSIMAMQTRWWSSHAVVTLHDPVPAHLNVRTLFSPLVPFPHYCRSSKPCTCRNVTVWHLLPGDQPFAPFENTHLLILCLFTSTRHTCTCFHVSTLVGSSALTEQGITPTLLVTQEMSLLGLCVCHLSGNVINYWWYTGLHISQVWNRSDHSVWVLHFS